MYDLLFLVDRSSQKEEVKMKSDYPELQSNQVKINKLLNQGFGSGWVRFKVRDIYYAKYYGRGGGKVAGEKIEMKS